MAKCEDLVDAMAVPVVDLLEVVEVGDDGGQGAARRSQKLQADRSQSSRASRLARPVSPSIEASAFEPVLHPLGPQGDADAGPQLDRVDRLDQEVDGRPGRASARIRTSLSPRSG
ncbi:MAG: hypothetical protein U0800_00285 [Isosphaeraceae bacterium]